MSAGWVAGTVDESFEKYVTIDGVGRVGTPSRMRSRARRHWVVAFYDGERTEHGYAHKAAEELGTFKTGTLAAEAAEKFAQEKGWKLGDYPKSFLDRRKNATQTDTFTLRS